MRNLKNEQFYKDRYGGTRVYTAFTQVQYAVRILFCLLWLEQWC
jgi:hypothetical protein